jgi:hypothetical protein
VNQSFAKPEQGKKTTGLPVSLASKDLQEDDPETNPKISIASTFVMGSR